MRVEFDLDIAPAVRALDAVPDALQARVNDASRVTAEAIVRDARARLQRQLSPNSTGQTVEGIHAVPAYDGNGWVLLADNDRMPNLPLWLEKGTRPGKRRNFARVAPRPFFYVAIEMEVGPHELRIRDAMAQTATVTGLGD